jgi:endoribonuclease Nob1
LDSRYILDAGAFYAGIPFLSSSSIYFTTQAVFNEVRHIKRSYAAIEALLDSGNLQLAEPGQEETRQVAATAKKTGDTIHLSKADISILALALSLEKAVLVTDDYAVANVAGIMEIPVKSTSSKGLKEIRRWINYCSGCGRTFGSEIKECPLCGNKLRRKYRKKTTI